MLVSLLGFILALVNNPFLLPFQDFDQMPQAQQEKYIRDAQLSDKIIIFSLLSAGATASIFVCTSYLIYKFRKKSESS